MQDRLNERLSERLDTLRREYEAGQAMLAELEAKQLDLRQTLLRIAGAIQVLEELLSGTEASGTDRQEGLPHAAGAPAIGRARVRFSARPGTQPTGARHDPHRRPA